MLTKAMMLRAEVTCLWLIECVGNKVGKHLKQNKHNANNSHEGLITISVLLVHGGVRNSK